MDTPPASCLGHGRVHVRVVLGFDGGAYTVHRGDPERPKYYPEDRAALLELPEGVEHYQVVDLQARW